MAFQRLGKKVGEKELGPHGPCNREKFYSSVVKISLRVLGKCPNETIP